MEMSHYPKKLAKGVVVYAFSTYLFCKNGENLNSGPIFRGLWIYTIHLKWHVVQTITDIIKKWGLLVINKIKGYGNFLAIILSLKDKQSKWSILIIEKPFCHSFHHVFKCFDHYNRSRSHQLIGFVHNLKAKRDREMVMRNIWPRWSSQISRSAEKF